MSTLLRPTSDDRNSQFHFADSGRPPILLLTVHLTALAAFCSNNLTSCSNLQTWPEGVPILARAETQTDRYQGVYFLDG